MTRYAVTGASGQLGRMVVEGLLTRGVLGDDVVAVVRTPAKAADLSLRGVQVRQGDCARPETLPNALAGEHRGTEEALRATGMPFTLLRNGWSIEGHTGEILSATDTGYSAAAASALLRDQQDNVVYELGGPAFCLDELAATIDVTGMTVVHRALPPSDYIAALEADILGRFLGRPTLSARASVRRRRRPRGVRR